MTRASRMDKTIQSLLPLESYRSPWVPTRRLGRDALVAVAAPFRQTSEVSVAPTVWFAVDPGFSMILSFSRTSVITPVSDFRPAAFESRPSSMSTREAHETLWRLSETVWPDFFGHRPPGDGVAAVVDIALLATVPGRLQSWLRLCCSDYFEWLALDPAVHA